VRYVKPAGCLVCMVKSGLISGTIRAYLRSRLCFRLILLFAVLWTTTNRNYTRAQGPPDAAARRLQLLRLVEQQQLLAVARGQGPRTIIEVVGDREDFTANFDSLLFEKGESAEDARKRVAILLANEISKLDRICNLRSHQTEKLNLAGRGDISRYFIRYESIKEHYVSQGEYVYADVLDKSAPLRQALNEGLFAEQSLFQRSIPQILTPEQSAKYKNYVQERMRARHLVDIDAACNWLERDVHLSGEQKGNIKNLMLRETAPARREGLGDIQYLLWQLERMPKGKLNDLVDADQLPKLFAYLRNFKDFRPEPRQTGLLEE
jgi:hypothetical protein